VARRTSTGVGRGLEAIPFGPGWTSDRPAFSFQGEIELLLGLQNVYVFNGGGVELPPLEPEPHSMTSEWVTWHKGYEGDQPQAKRLKSVQQQIREALDRAPVGTIRVISLCAGDGRDLIGALSSHPRAGEVEARLVELDPELVASGREQVARLDLRGIAFVLGDASTTRSCIGAVPANIVLICGIFGNISDEDVKRTIDHISELCARGATVIWTRGRFEPDLTPTIRGWFQEAGFEEQAFVPIPETSASVGAHRLLRAPRPFRDNEHLFTFLRKELRPSTRSRSREASTYADAGS
jgi:hypothetical protein